MDVSIEDLPATNLRMKKLAFTLIMSLISIDAKAAPFGINQGTKISALKIVNKRGDKTYIVQVPEPNSNFDSYGVMATPPHGVCAVFARTKAFSTWAEAKVKRNSVVRLLSKYGNPIHVKPELDYDTLSKRPPMDAYDLEWRMLSAPLSTVSLDVVSMDEGLSIRITYFYRNMAQCQNWEPKQDLRGL